MRFPAMFVYLRNLVHPHKYVVGEFLRATTTTTYIS